jgi:hypothetical protein
MGEHVGLQLQKVERANLRTTFSRVTGRGHLNACRYLGDCAMNVQRGQKRNVALLTADQYRYACHHGEVRMRDIRPGTPFQFLYESWQEQDL